MTLIGPFALVVSPGSTSSSVVSGSVFDAADSITLFASGVISAVEIALEGASELGAFPIFRNLTVPSAASVTGSQIAITEFEAVVVNPVPAVAGFRVRVDVAPVETESYALVGRTVPGVNANNLTAVTGSVAVVAADFTQSVLLDEPITVTGSVGVDQNADVTVTGSVGVDQNADVTVTGSVAVVAEPVDVTRSVTLDAQPITVTGSVAVVASTGSVTIDEQPIQVTGSFEIVGQPIDVTGSVAVVAEPVDVTRSVGIDAQPIEVTGSVTTAASTVATQSVSIVDSRVTQSVDLAFDDTVKIIASSSVVITPARPDVSPDTSPGGFPLTTFASMSRRPQP